MTGVVVAVLAGIVLPMLDRTLDSGFSEPVQALLFPGGTDAARTVLSTVAGSLATATSLTFSLTVVALQLASSQGSPRLLRMFARDGMVQATLAVFLGTFAYALTVLRSIVDAEEGVDPFVPRIAVTSASVLTIVSVIMLTLFLAHLARILRVETMLRDAHDETAGTIRASAESFDETPSGSDTTPPTTAARTVAADFSGFLTSVDRPRLIHVAEDENILIQELREVGASVVRGTELARWWELTDGAGDTSDERAARIAEAVRAAHRHGYERTAARDYGLGIRQIMDVALRALSTGINDPTTAVHALSHLSAIFREIVALPDAPGALLDDRGVRRLLPRHLDRFELVERSLREIRRYGNSDPEVVRRLYVLIGEVGFDADLQWRNFLTEQLRLIDTSVAAARYDDAEREAFRSMSTAAHTALGSRKFGTKPQHLSGA